MSRIENPYIKKDDNIIRFDLLKIEKNKKKLCVCKVPHFEVDSVNRLVYCTDCGAIIDPIDAIVRLADISVHLTEYQHEAKEIINREQQEIQKLLVRRRKLAIFKDMEESYKKDLLPRCPHCFKVFDPVDINSYGNRNYYDWEVKDNQNDS